MFHIAGLMENLLMAAYSGARFVALPGQYQAHRFFEAMKAEPLPLELFEMLFLGHLRRHPSYSICICMQILYISMYMYAMYANLYDHIYICICIVAFNDVSCLSLLSKGLFKLRLGPRATPRCPRTTCL